MPASIRPFPALLTIAVLTALVLFADTPFTGLWAVVLSDSAHGPVCAGIAAIVFHSLRRSTTQRWWIAIAATTLLGILIELVQGVIGRDAEAMDVLTDFLGAAAGSGLCVAFAWDSSRPQLHAGMLSAFTATALLAVPVVSMIGAYVARSTRFPVLMDGNAAFGASFITPFWTEPRQEALPPSANPRMPGERGLRVRATPPQFWWSIALMEVQHDWRPWRSLVIEVFNPRERSIPFHVRVFDKPNGLADDSGFIAHTRLEPRARTEWKLPLRDMKQVDLSHIYGMILFTASGDPDDDIYFLQMRLE